MILIDFIKSILESDPIDIYSEESNSTTETTIELCNSRNNKYGKYIGSANIFTAYITYCAVVLKKTANELTDEDIDSVYDEWVSILDDLKASNFIRAITKLELKLVVDNTTKAAL